MIKRKHFFILRERQRERWMKEGYRNGEAPECVCERERKRVEEGESNLSAIF